jgi:hypothetical protein
MHPLQLQHQHAQSVGVGLRQHSATPPFRATSPPGPGSGVGVGGQQSQAQLVSQRLASMAAGAAGAQGGDLKPGSGAPELSPKLQAPLMFPSSGDSVWSPPQSPTPESKTLAGGAAAKPGGQAWLPLFDLSTTWNNR